MRCVTEGLFNSSTSASLANGADHYHHSKQLREDEN